MKNKLICFIGTDGSGKSTVSQYLYDYYCDGNKRVDYVWAAYKLILLAPFVKLARMFVMKNRSPYHNYKEYVEDMDKATKKNLLLDIYKTVVLIEYIIEIFFKVTIPLFLGKTVICDRYVFDTVISISSNARYSIGKYRSMLKKWLIFFPKPDVVFYVSTPCEISCERKDDIPHPDFLRRRIPYYEDVENNTKVVVIDGTNSLDNLKQQMELFYKTDCGE